MLKWILGLAVIAVAAAAFHQLKFGDSLVYFYTPDEVAARFDELKRKNLRIGAVVETGSVRWNPEASALNFAVSDGKGQEFQVSYSGIKPDMFKEGQGVVVEGRFSETGETFLAKRLIVKHSEEYRKPDDHRDISRELLEKSILK